MLARGRNQVEAAEASLEVARARHDLLAEAQLTAERTRHELDLVRADPPFAQRAPTGFIGLQRHAPGRVSDTPAYAWYRNLFLREL